VQSAMDQVKHVQLRVETFSNQPDLGTS
jgi:hypothetical protein